MSTYFIDTSDTIRLKDLPNKDFIQDTLKPGYYTFRCIKTMEGKEYFFTVEKPFNLPNKLYGTVEKRADIIVNSYKNTHRNLGVLLQGLGGTGKTLLSKLVCNRLYNELNIPIIMIKDVDSAMELEYMMKNIKTKAVIFIDEYEKVFNNTLSSYNDQSFLLTLLDGTVNTNYLFLLTINELYGVNDHLLSRPGRIRYFFCYNGINRNEIYHLCKDNLPHLKEDDINRITESLLTLDDSCTYDIVMSMINEMLLYPEEDVYSILMRLNTSLISSRKPKLKSIFNISLMVDSNLSMNDWLNIGLVEGVEKLTSTVNIGVDSLFTDKSLSYLEDISNDVLPSFSITSIIPSIIQLNQDIEQGVYSVSLTNKDTLITGYNTLGIETLSGKLIRLNMQYSGEVLANLARIKVNYILITFIRELLSRSKCLSDNNQFNFTKPKYKLETDYYKLLNDTLSSDLFNVVKDIKCSDDLNVYFKEFKIRLENHFINELTKYNPSINLEYNEKKSSSKEVTEINSTMLLNNPSAVKAKSNSNNNGFTLGNRGYDPDIPF